MLKANGLEIVDMPVSFERVDTDAALAKTVAFCRRFNVDFLYIPWFGDRRCGACRRREVGRGDVFAKDLSNAEENGKGWKWDEIGFLTPVAEDTIFSRKDYGNFVLNVAYVMDPTANGGLFLYDTKHPTHKFEVQILDDHHPMYEKEVPCQNTGSTYGRLAPAKVNSYPAGEINVMSCWCMGSRIRITLNYETVVDTDLSAWKDPLVNPDGTRVPKWHEGRRQAMHNHSFGDRNKCWLVPREHSAECSRGSPRTRMATRLN